MSYWSGPDPGGLLIKDPDPTKPFLWPEKKYVVKLVANYQFYNLKSEYFQEIYC
jgi:hypothetical protein